MLPSQPQYLCLSCLISLMEEPYRSGCLRLYADHCERFEQAWGASHNHQAWRGGYKDHVSEVMNLGVQFYQVMNKLRPLPFSLSDTLLCLFFHDIEKPWKYLEGGSDETPTPRFKNKAERHAFRMGLATEYNIPLTEEHIKGIRYAEGEPDEEYSPTHRVMTPLASFVHACDNLSARLWFDFPLAKNDPWATAGRLRSTDNGHKPS